MGLAQLSGNAVKNEVEVWTRVRRTDGGGKVETTL